MPRRLILPIVSLVLSGRREERARARERHTLVGLCKSVLGYSFALYCVFRLWTAFDSAVRRNPTRSDPVAALVGLAMWALSGGRVHVSKAALRQVVTVVFVVTVLGNSLVRRVALVELRGGHVLSDS